MAAVVLPGQPLHSASADKASRIVAGRGAFTRGQTIYSSSIGTLQRDGGVVSVDGAQKSDESAAMSIIPEIGNVVLGIVTRLTRVQAVLKIISVDGLQCQQDWQGIIRTSDIRPTDKDKMKIWDCFRPGDVVRAVVISLGDARAYYCDTSRQDMGVIFARHSDTGNRLQAISQTEMQDASTGQAEFRKVAVLS